MKLFATFFVAATIALLALESPGLAQEAAEKPSTKAGAQQAKEAPADPEKQKLIEKLERYLTGTRWIGNFTVTGKELGDLTPEYYEITKAVKVPDGDYWILTVRIKYGKNDTSMTLPPIEIKWAGGTPVITVDKVAVIGLGTFDARVVIRNNKYAGTWAHDNVGGHLFGEIKRIEKEDASDDKGASGKKK